MKLIGMMRLGRDVETRYTGDGTPVANMVGAWNYGRKDESGRQASQWAELAMFGERAEKLAPYLLKGQQVFVVAGDVNIQTFEKREGGQSVKLVGRVESLEFGERPRQAEGSAAAPAQRPAQAPVQRPAARPATKPGSTGSGFDDMDDDIPF
jgi:single-strand DNA-binding protein